MCLVICKEETQPSLLVPDGTSLDPVIRSIPEKTHESNNTLFNLPATIQKYQVVI